MNREQALQTIGLDDSATQDQVSLACRIKSEQLAQRITSAPTPALRATYETALKEIGVAAGVLGVQIVDINPTVQVHAHETPLSQTKLQDLPSSTPVPTVSDSSAATLDDLQVAQQLGLQKGQMLAGRYEIRDLIGMGGMGAVYSAYDSHLDEEIAIKVLTPSLLKNEQARERFINEARTSSRLSHPNIVNVHDVQREGDLFFITMELLRGKSLRQEIETRNAAGEPFGLEFTKTVAKAVGEALTFAHTTTIHRDIKPENVWIGSDGQIKLMDFGIARVLSTSRLTQTAMVMGTAYYMAPEQLQGSRDVDARADQYALAVVLYEMLTGKIPAGRVKSVRALRPAVPRSMSAAIDKALEADPEDRFANVPAFLDQIDGTVTPWQRKGIIAGAAVAALAGVLLLAFTGPGNRLAGRVADFVVAPGAVKELKVQNASQNAITLTWESEPPNAAKLLVLRSENSRDGYMPVGEVDPGAKSYKDDRNVEPEKSYFYKVIAQNTAGKFSKVSETPSLRAESLPLAPPVPTQLEIARRGTKELELTWKGRYPAGTTAALLRSTTADGEFLPVIENLELADGENRYIDSHDLQPDTQYFYKLAAAYKGVSSPQMAPKAQRTLPLAPQKPEVKPGDVSQTTVKLTWPNEYKPGTTMRIERSELKNSNYQVISETHDASLGVFEDSLEPKKQYFYKFTAIQDTQPSPVAGPIEVLTKPSQPGIVTALKGVARDGKLTLTWASAADPAITYEVRHYSAESSQPTVLAQLGPGQTVYEHLGPANEDAKYEVVAVNGGVASTPAVISIPAAPRVTATRSQHGALLEWARTGAASSFVVYRVGISRVPEKLTETTENMFVDHTTEPGTEYDYFVSALSGSQGISESLRQKVAVSIDAPQNVRITAKDARTAEISWEKASAPGITGYEIERTESSATTSAKFTADRGAVTYLDSGLAPGKSYLYTVSAVSATGERGTSPQVSFAMTGSATGGSSAQGARRSSGAAKKRGNGAGNRRAEGTPAPAKPPPRHTPTPPVRTPNETPCPPGVTPVRTPRPVDPHTPPPKETLDPRVTTPPFHKPPKTSDPRVTTPPFGRPQKTPTGIKVAPTPHPAQNTPSRRRPMDRRPEQQRGLDPAKTVLDGAASRLFRDRREGDSDNSPASQ